MTVLSVRIGARGVGLNLDTPLLVAAGTFGADGFGAGVLVGDLVGVGAVVLKTVTWEPRVGNPEPRLWPDGFGSPGAAGGLYLNSVGLANPGVEVVLCDVIPSLVGLGVPVILSIAADSFYGWGDMGALAGACDGLAGLELNLSCPNVSCGAAFSHDARLAGAVVALVRREVDVPVWAKLSPNVPDIREVGLAAEAAGADGLTVCNTMPGMAIDVWGGVPVLGGVYGGLSGPALRPISLRLVHQLSGVVGIPVIGVGGVSTGDDVAQYLMAGAAAVQIGTAFLSDTSSVGRICSEFCGLLREMGLEDCSGLSRV